jgi:hypothetical protein
VRWKGYQQIRFIADEPDEAPRLVRGPEQLSW